MWATFTKVRSCYYTYHSIKINFYKSYLIQWFDKLYFQDISWFKHIIQLWSDSTCNSIVLKMYIEVIQFDYEILTGQWRLQFEKKCQEFCQFRLNLTKKISYVLSFENFEGLTSINFFSKSKMIELRQKTITFYSLDESYSKSKIYYIFLGRLSLNWQNSLHTTVSIALCTIKDIDRCKIVIATVSNVI